MTLRDGVYGPATTDNPTNLPSGPAATQHDIPYRVDKDSPETVRSESTCFWSLGYVGAVVGTVPYFSVENGLGFGSGPIIGAAPYFHTGFEWGIGWWGVVVPVNFLGFYWLGGYRSRIPANYDQTFLETAPAFIGVWLCAAVCVFLKVYFPLILAIAAVIVLFVFAS